VLMIFSFWRIKIGVDVFWRPSSKREAFAGWE
jgi:hypothetical protein